MTPLVAPSDYGHLIDLDVSFDRRSGAERLTPARLAGLAGWLLEDAGGSRLEVPGDPGALRRLIGRLLTVRPPRPFPDEVLKMLDSLWAFEAASRPVVGIDDVLASGPRGTTAGGIRLCVWCGDITTLATDAIVNAANADLLGCFRPGHACIDNAIHTAAGPRLRDDCYRVMSAQAHREPTGMVKITRAYYLPSRFVLHTVGPIVEAGAVVAARQRAQLAGCYEACLEMTAARRLRSVAFCAISTGVFGYPKADAAAVALATVRGWLARHPAELDLVVFDVFSAADEDVYERELSRA